MYDQKNNPGGYQIINLKADININTPYELSPEEADKFKSAKPIILNALGSDSDLLNGPYYQAGSATSVASRFVHFSEETGKPDMLLTVDFSDNTVNIAEIA